MSVDKEAEKKRKKKEKANSSVFVSGLPPTIDEEEIAKYFAKCGVLKKDPETAEAKVKIYPTEDKEANKTALITYYRPESVELAKLILDTVEIQPGFPLKVENAVFEKSKERGGQQSKPKKKSKKIKRYNQEKELSWEEDDNCHVILKHMFTQEEAWQSPNFFDELKEDIIVECEKIGEVKNIKMFERNPEGVVAVKFVDHVSAARCVEVMNGRFFAGQKLEAELYDGWTDYEVKETEEQKEARIKQFESWIDNQE